MKWLGLRWEEPVLCQSTRTDAYRSALAKLDRLRLIYPCFCTRREIADEVARAVGAPHESESDSLKYPGTCRALTVAQRERRIASGERYAIRLDSANAAARCGLLRFEECGIGPRDEHGIITVDSLLFGDVVLARKDLPAAYHLAVVVDDAHQGVTLVTRGNDLYSATHIQRVLQQLLELPVPRYAHHRLILDETGRKYSKRDRAVTLRSLSAEGTTPDAIRKRLGLKAI